MVGGSSIERRVSSIWWAGGKKSAAEGRAVTNSDEPVAYSPGAILELVDGFLVTKLVGHDLFGCVIVTGVATVAGRLGRNHEAV